MESTSEFTILKKILAIFLMDFGQHSTKHCSIFAPVSSENPFIHSFKNHIYWVPIFCQVCCVLLGIQEDTSHIFCPQKANNLTSDLDVRLLSGHDTIVTFTIVLPPRQRERLYKSKGKHTPESIRRVPGQWKFWRSKIPERKEVSSGDYNIWQCLSPWGICKLVGQKNTERLLNLGESCSSKVEKLSRVCHCLTGLGNQKLGSSPVEKEGPK